MTTPRAAISVFAAGTHVASDGNTHTFSEADIQELVDSYDPAVAEAPLVVGHPKTDAPAYGWAKSLDTKDGVLLAEPYQVEPQFAELVNTGRLKKISASIYLRDTPGNPKPGKLYLKHIGFLGATAPAVKGLPSAQFNDGGAAPEFSMPGLGWSLRDLFQRLRDWMIERDGVESADRVIPQYQINAIDEATSGDDTPHPAFAEHQTTETDMSDKTTPAEFAEREAQLQNRQAEIEQREQALRDREASAHREDAVAFVEHLASKEVGKLLPRQKSRAVELLLALPAGTVLNFSEAEGEAAIQKPAAEVFREFLEDLPRQVDFSEKSRETGGAALANFSAPAGTQIDAGRAELYSRAKAYQAQHPDVSFVAAVEAVGG